MPHDRLPAYFSPIRDLIKRYNETVEISGATPVEAAIHFIKSIRDVDFAIVGIRYRGELEEVVAAFSKEVHEIEYEQYAVTSPELVDPRNWPKLRSVAG